MAVGQKVTLVRHNGCGSQVFVEILLVYSRVALESSTISDSYGKHDEALSHSKALCNTVRNLG